MPTKLLCPNPNDVKCFWKMLGTLPGPGSNIIPAVVRVTSRSIVIDHPNRSQLTLPMSVRIAGAYAVENPQVIFRPQEFGDDPNTNSHPVYVLSHEGTLQPGESVPLEGSIQTQVAAVAMWLLIPATPVAATGAA